MHASMFVVMPQSSEHLSRHQIMYANIYFVIPRRLVGLVVKESASRAEDPGFEFRLRFFLVESYQ